MTLCLGITNIRLPRIVHFSASEPYTKYEMVLIFAALLGHSVEHIVPDDTDPSAKDGVLRPRDCKLDTRETEALIGGPTGGVLDCVLFEEWWKEELTK